MVALQDVTIASDANRESHRMWQVLQNGDADQWIECVITNVITQGKKGL